MKQLMVISHDTYASGCTELSSDLDDLTASLALGAYAMIDMDPEAAGYNQVADISHSGETPTKFMFVVKTANGLKCSPIITKANCTVKYKLHLAPQAKVMNISVTLTGLETGQTAGFSVTDLTKPVHILTRVRNYTYTLLDGDTEAIIIAKLILLVNADPLAIVTASAGTDIVLTADVAGTNFQIAPIGIFRGGAFTQTTANILGFNTSAQLREYEHICNVERGKANYPEYRDKTFPAVSEVSGSAIYYDTWIFRFNIDSERPVLESENPDQELVMALYSTASSASNHNSRQGLTLCEADFNV